LTLNVNRFLVYLIEKASISPAAVVALPFIVPGEMAAKT
jgi:hypothetical protein